jgi:predicted nucleotidyltransferase
VRCRGLVFVIILWLFERRALPHCASHGVLNATERSCLERYLDFLVQTLGDRLLEVSAYGSVARGEPWPRGMQIRSDLDLMVITSEPVPRNVVEALVDATMPLFLECGRQLGPVFKTPTELAYPKSGREAEFFKQFRQDAVPLYDRQAPIPERVDPNRGQAKA